MNKVLFLPSSLENCLIASKKGRLSISPTVPPISQITKCSFENCLIASKKGRLSISPTVPPISHITKSSLATSFLINSLILLVMCGIT